MQITEKLKSHLNKELSSFLGESIEILDYSILHGGSVNYSFLLKTTQGPFFIKLNHAKAFPKMFGLEVKGLEEIRFIGSLNVPNIIIEGSFEETAYLVLEYIEQAAEKTDFWETFGIQLASLHQAKQERYGLSYSNYIGSLKQHNKTTKSWANFFANERILAQSILAFDRGRIDSSLLHLLETLSGKIEQFFPESTASLLHGDLWSGNFMIDKNGLPVVMDPAIYYGNREMDIAMSMLFGGFNKRFYQAYNESYPLSKNWEERIDLCNAYPLLVHVNLFGASYAQRLKNAIKRYV